MSSLPRHALFFPVRRRPGTCISASAGSLLIGAAVAMCLVLAALPTNAGPSATPGARLIETGDVAWRAGNLKEAILSYVRAAADPQVLPQVRSLALQRRALAEERLGDSRAALATWDALAARDDAPRHHRDAARLRAALLRGERRTVAPPPTVVSLPPAFVREFHVAVDGDDAGDGSAARPFASLERARDAIRAAKAAGPVAVTIHGGDYPVRSTFGLTAADSGTEGAPVVYRAAPGARPRFTGGARVTGFTAVTDAAVLARLPAEARRKVLQADLRARGLAWPAFAPGGYGSGRGFRNMTNEPWFKLEAVRPQLEVFWDGRPLPLASWPEKGWLRITGTPGERKVTIAEDRVARWVGERDLWIYGYYNAKWADSNEKIEAVNGETRTLTVAAPAHRLGFRVGGKFRVLNALSELDQPGEWYLDHAAGILYLYPPGDPDTAAVEVSTFAEAMVHLDDVRHVVFQGLTWDLTCNDVLRIRGGARCAVVGCTIRRVAADGIVIMGGDHHTVLGTEVAFTGRGGVVLVGGDRQTLTGGGHLVENCHIHDLSRIEHTYTPAVYIAGVGHRLARCRLHESPSSAMRLEGNDHLIELNEIFDVVKESDDQGGADMWLNPTYRGNVFRWNYWYRMGGTDPHWQGGIRLDDAISGTLITGNVFFRCSPAEFGAVQIHGGKDNWVDGNVAIEGQLLVSFTPWTEAKWTSRFGRHKGTLFGVPVNQPPWSERYPELARIGEDPNLNHHWGNIAYNCQRLFNREPPGGDAVGNALLASPFPPGPAAPTLADLARVLAKEPLLPIPLSEIGTRDAP